MEKTRGVRQEHAATWKDVEAFTALGFGDGDDIAIDGLFEAYGNRNLVPDKSLELFNELFEPGGIYEDKKVNEKLPRMPDNVTPRCDGWDGDRRGMLKSVRRALSAAVRCLDMLQGSRLLGWQDTLSVGILPSCSYDGKIASLELEWSLLVEGGNYIQYLADSCESLSKVVECSLTQALPDDPPDEYWGWCGVHLAELNVICGRFEVETEGYSDYPEKRLSDAQARACLRALVNALITVHIQGSRPYVSGEGELRLSGGCLLSGIWMVLNDAQAKGRVALCPNCGKVFVAYDDRGNPRVWCESNGTCAKKGQRARLFGRLCESGKDPVSAGREAHIRPLAARRILASLGELNEKIDYGA